MSLAYNDSPVVRQLNPGPLQSPSALFMAEAWDMEGKLYPFCQEVTFIFGQLQWFLRKCFPVWVWTCISVIFNHCSLLCLLCPPKLKLFSSSWLLFYYVKTSISLPIPSSSLFQRVFIRFTCWDLTPVHPPVMSITLRGQPARPLLACLMDVLH